MNERSLSASSIEPPIHSVYFHHPMFSTCRTMLLTTESPSFHTHHREPILIQLPCQLQMHATQDRSHFLMDLHRSGDLVDDVRKVPSFKGRVGFRGFGAVTQRKHKTLFVGLKMWGRGHLLAVLIRVRDVRGPRPIQYAALGARVFFFFPSLSRALTIASHCQTTTCLVC